MLSTKNIYSLLGFVVMIGIAITLFFVYNTIEVEYPIPEKAEVIVDRAVFFKSFENGKKTTTSKGNFVVFVGGMARFFYLPNNIRHFKEYYEFLNAESGPNILKLTIGDKTDEGFPIIKIELPDSNDERYISASEMWKNSL